MSKQIARSKKYFHVTIEMKEERGPLEWTRKKFFARRLDNSKKKKREVVTKEAVSAHKEKQTELEQTELPDQDPKDKKSFLKKILQRKILIGLNRKNIQTMDPPFDGLLLIGRPPKRG